MPPHTISSAAARLCRLLCFTGALMLADQRAVAASFTVASGTTDNAAKTLGSGSGQTGTVAATGTLAVSGSTVAVTISGTNATLTNNGTITQTGTGRAIRDNTGVTGLVITNNAGALIQTADADVFQMNKSPASVTLNNYGTMTSLNASIGGAQAVDFNAILSGSNVINNFSTGILQAQNADAVRPGVNGFVYNDGKILSTHTTDTGDDGIDAQNNSGITIVNANSNDPAGFNLIEGARHGITGGALDNTVTFTMSITNNANGTIKGDDGSGLNIDGFNANETVTIVNHGTITGNGVTADGDGVDVDGVVNLTNTGTIKSLNSHNDVSEGVTVGGGTITNSGTIEGAIDPLDNSGTGRGITIAGVDKDASDNPIPVEAPYAATTIHNEAGGLIKGDSDTAISFTSQLTSGFSHTITNDAGATIQTGSVTAPAIFTGADAVTINNSGTIDGSSSGKAIAGGTGNLTVNILGSSASVLGDLTGGTGPSTVNALNFDLGAANRTFGHSGAISNFATVDIVSGQVTLTGTVALAGGSTTLTVDSGALLSPGAGSLAISGGATTVDGTLSFDLDGVTAGTDYGQLVFGSGAGLTLESDSTLAIDLGFTPTLGEQFELIDLFDGSIDGTFGGLAEGSTFMADGTTFQISYVGGTGNDLTLTVTAVPEPATWAAIIGVGALAFAWWWRRSARARLG